MDSCQILRIKGRRTRIGVDLRQVWPAADEASRGAGMEASIALGIGLEITLET